MGPLLLVDKSAIQSFSKDEIDVLNRHYMVVICPILIQEIKANLVKYPDDPDLSKDKVSHLAKKANGFGAETIDRHERLCHASFMGLPIRLFPQIPRFDGTDVVATDGSRGVLFDETPETRTLRQWQYGNFTEEEVVEAQKHVDAVANYDLEGSRKFYADKHPENTQFKSLEEIAAFAESPFMETAIGTWTQIQAYLKGFGYPASEQAKIQVRWSQSQNQPFKTFAEYAHFCHRLNTIFWLGVTAGLIPTSKESKAIVDYQYFYYLPFVNGICSGDKFHRDFFKHVQRDDQFFVWAPELKADLRAIGQCHANMSESDRRYYDRNFGNYPPPMQNSITVEMWRKYMRPWEPGSGNRALDMSPEEQKKTMDHINSLLKGTKWENWGKKG